MGRTVRTVCSSIRPTLVQGIVLNVLFPLGFNTQTEEEKILSNLFWVEERHCGLVGSGDWPGSLPSGVSSPPRPPFQLQLLIFSCLPCTDTMLRIFHATTFYISGKYLNASCVLETSEEKIRSRLSGSLPSLQ